MSTGQQITLGLALALVIASLWRGQQLQPIWSVVINQQQGNTQIGPALKNVGADALFLLIIVWLAGLTPDASKMTGALLVGMWLLFLFHAPRESGSGATSNTSSINVLGVIPIHGV